MSIFKCKMCGGTIEFEQGASVGVCDSCGTKQTLPKLDDDRRTNLYDRANHFRRGNEFDKAAGIYEQILNEDNTDSEAYWSLVLCRYGIEYVEDPSTHKRVPTVNRAQFTSIFDDDNYRSALQYADGYQRSIYEEEAAAINEIQKGILAISQKEEPFDVFICYKETDSSGRRTQDSVLANDLYHQLTNEGFKVFFARITLEDKLGTAYEPYIFAALNSAKVMVVLGTKQEHFNAVWVKNEWSRYLALVKQSGGKKILIPAYRDMDPYDLPEEFSHLQAQDMSKLGFMQDLIRGIKKIIAVDEPKAVVKETVVMSGGAETASLLKRAFMYLEDRDWKSADEYCERVLDKEPENAVAYLGKLLAELNVTKEELLPSLKRDFSDSKNYQKSVRFGNNRLADLNKKAIYNNAADIMNSANSEERFKEAARIFKGLLQFEDAPTKADECLAKAEEARKESIYRSGCIISESVEIDSLKKGISLFKSILDYKDADELAEKCRIKIEEINAENERVRLEKEREAEQARIAEEKRKKRNKKIAAITIPTAIVCIAIAILLPTVIIPTINYNAAMSLYENGEYQKAIATFTEMNGYKDSNDMILQCNYDISVGLYNLGKYDEALAFFEANRQFSDSDNYAKMCYYNLAQKDESNGNIVNAAINYAKAADYNGGMDKSLQIWDSVVEKRTISASGSTSRGVSIGIKTDGTVTVSGGYDSTHTDLANWNDIVSVCSNEMNVVGLRSDHTVLATFEIPDDYGVSISDFHNIVDVCASWFCIELLEANGDIHKIYDGEPCYKKIALNDVSNDMNEGAVHFNFFLNGECEVNYGKEIWSDIKKVATGFYHTIGLKKDGSMAGYFDTEEDQSNMEQFKWGSKNYGQGNVSGYNDIVDIAAGYHESYLLKSDGTVVFKGRDDKISAEVSKWRNIIQISASGDHVIGLQEDGKVVAAGENDNGECNVSGWRDIKVPNK